MSDIADTINEAVEKAKESRLNSFIAVTVTVSATFLALCSVKGSNIGQSMAQAQANAVDAWAHYQSDSIRQHIAERMSVRMQVFRDSDAHIPIEARAIYETKIIDYIAKATLLDDDDGKTMKKAQDFEKLYEALGVHDDQMDAAEAGLSIAIVLFGLTALTQRRWILVFAAAFTVFGFVMGMAGFVGSDLRVEAVSRLLG
jgi:hypothetical protein